MTDEFAYLGIAEAARLIRAKKLSPVEYTQALLARIERLDPKLNAFLRQTPDIAGRGNANPLAAILSFALALRHTFAAPNEADLLERAVKDTVARGVRTADIKGSETRAVSTKDMGDAVIGALERLNG